MGGPEDTASRWARAGALGALALYLGYLETFVPIPIPGVRLGLANIAILLALSEGDAAGAVWAAAIKVLASAVFFGTPVTLAYSAVGTALSLAVMVPLSRLETMRLTMLSVTGALAHVLGQVAVAGAVLGTATVWYGAPVLAVGSCVTGALSGMVAERAADLIRQGQADATPLPAARTATVTSPLTAHEPTIREKLSLVSFAALACLVLWSQSPTTVLPCLACSLLACMAARVRGTALAGAMRPLVPMLVIAIGAQLLLGEFSLVQCLVMLARLGSITLGGVALAASVGASGMAGLARWTVSPLGRLGLDVQGAGHAMEVALGILPVLVGRPETGGALTDMGERENRSIKGLLDALPHAVARAWQLALAQDRQAGECATGQ